jgi:hypothetical protein
MAHFAQIDDNNIVINVLVVPDEQQHRGNEYLSNDLGLGGRWIQTSYNNRTRNMFAGLGYIYNEDLDIFLPPKPYPSWVLDTENKEWVAPVSRPEDIENTALIWNEQEQKWERQNLPPIILQSE